MNFANITRPKLVRAALALCLALSLANMASAELRVGASRVEITPPLANGSEAPTGKYEHEHLYVRAIVIDNGQTWVTLLGADQSNMQEGVWSEAAKQIAKDLDCPLVNILISATHTHSPGVTLGPPAGPPVLGDPLPAAQQCIVSAMSAPSGYIPDDALSPIIPFKYWLKPGCAEDAIANGLTNLIIQFEKSQS